MPRLHVLDASGNNLTGVVPPTFGNLSALSALSLDSNNLSGPPRHQSRQPPPPTSAPTPPCKAPLCPAPPPR
ncbi:unnamed protein product [Camellia sinensis]